VRSIWVSAARVGIVSGKQPRDKPANQVGDGEQDWDGGYCQNDRECTLHLLSVTIDKGRA
jgi:hypothetical protein